MDILFIVALRRFVFTSLFLNLILLNSSLAQFKDDKCLIFAQAINRIKSDTALLFNNSNLIIADSTYYDGNFLFIKSLLKEHSNLISKLVDKNIQMDNQRIFDSSFMITCKLDCTKDKVRLMSLQDLSSDSLLKIITNPELLLLHFSNIAYSSDHSDACIYAKATVSNFHIIYFVFFYRMDGKKNYRLIDCFLLTSH